RGMIHQLRGDRIRALNDFTRAFQLDPEVVVACWTRGLASTAKEKYARTIADYAEGIRPDPQDSEETETPQEPAPRPSAERSRPRSLRRSHNGSAAVEANEITSQLDSRTLHHVGKETIHQIEAASLLPSPQSGTEDEQDDDARSQTSR